MAEDKNVDTEEMTIDVVTFVDDDGNEIEMEIVEEFEHKGEKYAVLAEISDEEDPDAESKCEGGCACTSDTCECADEDSLYIFHVVQGEDGEEFLAIDDDDLLDELTVIVEEMFAQDEE